MRTALFLVVALVLASGCELRADVDVRVDADGSGVLAIELAVDPALEAEARAAGFDLVDAVASAVEGLDGWETHAEERRVRLRTTFSDPDELREISAAFADALAGPELRPLEPIEVTLTDDRLAVATAAALEPTGAVAEIGLDPAEATALLADSVDYRISLELPGEILAHDADTAHGQRLVWDVPAGQRVEARAEAARPQRPLLPVTPLTVGLLGAVLAVVVGLAALAATRRARRRRRGLSFGR